MLSVNLLALSVGPPSCSHRKTMSPLVLPTSLRPTSLALLPSSTSSSPSSRASSLPAATTASSSSSLSLLTRERAHCHLKYIRALSASVILPGKRRVAMLIKPTDVEETAENDGEYYSDTDVGAFPFDTCWLDAKLQLKLEQKMRMKVPRGYGSGGKNLSAREE
ncbi:hypothetical protein NL676_001546 [Syzygium grande]|nr:hypothetical protein NL676_001546 [Syzygium grande]